MPEAMFDIYDQAQGLQGYAASAMVARFMVVPTSGQGGVSHRLLWLMARRFAQQGEPVCVLDGSADEAPGQGLLAGLQAASGLAYPHPLELGEEAAPGVYIVAARQGLMRLARAAQEGGGPQAWDHLRAALPAHCHVLLTAPADVLAVCLQGTLARPLVALDGQPRALVEAYNAVKLLLQVGDLHAVLVPMVPAAPTQTGTARSLALGEPAWQAVDAPVQALARCAQAYLNESLQIWPLAYDECRGRLGDRVPEAWWLKVVDSAIVLTRDLDLDLYLDPMLWGPTTSADTPMEHRRS